MAQSKTKQIFKFGWQECFSIYRPSNIQKKAVMSILRCKIGALGCSASICPDCGHTKFHKNFCRNRNCASCQAVNKEIWVDKRRAEGIDAPYFHVVFTLPHELIASFLCNQ